MNGLYSKPAIEFMRRNGMHQDDIDIGASFEKYLAEMEKGLKAKAMLPMMPTYVRGDLKPARGQKALAVDVGGTNLRLALVELDRLGRVRVSRLKKEELPGLKGPVTSGYFFEKLADYIAPYFEFTNIIGFSFAHEIRHTPGLDGEVTALSKELTVEGILGEFLGENLSRELKKRCKEEAKIVVLNDTVGVAGCMAHKYGVYDSLIGLVMGTGTNTCYVERSRNIGKINDAVEGSMFINVESAEFDPIERGAFDYELDATMELPGAAPLEKMISGRYIGSLFRLTVKHAAEEGLLSGRFREAFNKSDMLDTIAMSCFMSDPYSGEYADMCGGGPDRAFLYTVAETLVKRGAKLIALEIAAAAIKSGKGKTKERPLCIVAEGTTYYTLKGLKGGVERLLRSWLKPMGVYVAVKRVDNAAIKGIGLIALSYL